MVLLYVNHFFSCSKSQHYEGIQKQYRKLLMKFMSHPVSKIRQHTYSTILQTIQVKYYYLFAGGWGGSGVQKVVDEVYVSSCLQDTPAYLLYYLTNYTGKILLPLCLGWGG